MAQDDAQAVKWYRKAADQRLTRAALALATFLEEGRGTEKNIDEAIEYYQIAYSGRSLPASQNLGRLVVEGQLDDAEAPENSLIWVGDAAAAGMAEAVDWLVAKAEGGEPFAYQMLGELYREGKGVDADTAAAARYYKPAAEAGFPHAQLQLGLLLAAGDGVEQNLIEAHKWVNLAAANGLDQAAERRDVLANLMTPEQIAQAQARARVYMRKN